MMHTSYIYLTLGRCCPIVLDVSYGYVIELWLRQLVSLIADGFLPTPQSALVDAVSWAAAFVTPRCYFCQLRPQLSLQM